MSQPTVHNENPLFVLASDPEKGPLIVDIDDVQYVPRVATGREKKKCKRFRIFHRIILALLVIFLLRKAISHHHFDHFKKKRIHHHLSEFLDSVGWPTSVEWPPAFHWEDGDFCVKKDLIPWDGPDEFVVDVENFDSLAIFFESGTAHGYIDILSSSEVSDIVVLAPILIDGQDLQDKINIEVSEGEDGLYKINITTPKYLHHRCIKTNITILFPGELQEFNNLTIAVNNFDIHASGLPSTEFNNTILATVQGNVEVESLKSSTAHAVTVRGFVTGEFEIEKLFSGMSVHGGVDAYVLPPDPAETLEGSGVRIIAGSLKGDVALRVDAQRYRGNFTLSNLFGGVELKYEGPDDDLHIIKAGRNRLEGYLGDGESENKIELKSLVGLVELAFD